ncbi:Fic family protein [Aquamicrobium sp.]|jgi:Fic family protein|uniref:Fic family protein n=1 Tax=Aquamicrobium sp. TaxID=1872579 RepID=UPI002585AEF9|nr:Fic family protein [Aquamicrobium sp.]MCK9553268.1 Fic family protein [Aquamicrobium sp.]
MNIDIDKINNLKIDFKFIPNQKLYFALAKKDKVDFIYNTSALEGNAMTFPEVQTLLEGVTIGGHKLSDEQQILNQNRSVNLLFEMIENNTFGISKNIFCELQSKVAFEEALIWGKFRDGHVNIGGTEYSPPLAGDLDNIFTNGIVMINKISNPILKAIVFFLFGAKNQFFYDGNKRTSRLMMNGILLQEGYPMLNIKAKDKLEFNEMMLDFYDTDDIFKAISYLSSYYHRQNKVYIS